METILFVIMILIADKDDVASGLRWSRLLVKMILNINEDNLNC